MCWYKTKEAAAAKKKTCMKMFSQPEFTVYGYQKEEPNKVRDIIPNERKFAAYGYNMDENMFFGRYCKTGLAVVVDATSMMCIQISEIRSNFDDYKKI